jgi:4-hydroxy-tetrahydrodipicolinate reductase
MKIGLIGYGKMGKEIEAVALGRGHEISGRWTSSNPLTPETLEGTDVAIEFSRPDTVVTHIRQCLDAGVGVVVGTTGWYDRFGEIRSICESRQGMVFSATNFSLGVNIAFHVNEVLARIMGAQEGYELGLTEIHHSRKLDEPSGTAISFAEGIIQNNPRFNGWALTHMPAFAKSGEIPVESRRLGEVPGTHIVQWQSDIDTLILSHEAHNRQGFALGAVLAAEWSRDKKGMLGMKDMLEF